MMHCEAICIIDEYDKYIMYNNPGRNAEVIDKIKFSGCGYSQL